jgi:hypothetical protein
MKKKDYNGIYHKYVVINQIDEILLGKSNCYNIIFKIGVMPLNP